jgi:hypothetical protein
VNDLYRRPDRAAIAARVKAALEAEHSGAYAVGPGAGYDPLAARELADVDDPETPPPRALRRLRLPGHRAGPPGDVRVKDYTCGMCWHNFRSGEAPGDVSCNFCMAHLCGHCGLWSGGDVATAGGPPASRKGATRGCPLISAGQNLAT